MDRQVNEVDSKGAGEPQKCCEISPFGAFNQSFLISLLHIAVSCLQS